LTKSLPAKARAKENVPKATIHLKTLILRKRRRYENKAKKIKAPIKSSME